MTMTLHRLGAGDGYRYLTDSVAGGDVPRQRGQSVADYYAQSGNNPGFWTGQGAAVLGVEGTVTTEQMHRLYGLGLHPVSGVQLGRRYQLYRTVAERVADRLAHVDQPAPEFVAALEREEMAKGERQAVAGFDAVFSPVKSVSVAWALADPDVAGQLEDAHHAAVAETVRWWESDVAYARTGAGGVAQVDVAGVAVACFDHRTSRSGDPDLHTHAVLSNKVLARPPGGGSRWLTLDSKAMYHAAVAASERYNRVLEDEIGRRLGWRFAPREDQDPAAATAIRELEFMPLALVRGFSARRAQIEGDYDKRITDYHAAHGHTPPRAVQYELAQAATLAHRPAKEAGETVGAERARWAGEAAGMVSQEVLGGVVSALSAPPALLAVRTARDVSQELVAEFAAAALADVTERRATWTRRHLQAAAQRATRGWVMASAAAREALVSRVVEQALEQNVVRLDPDDLVEVPRELTRADGESVFSRHAGTRYTTQAQLEAEDALLAHARRTDAPSIDGRCVSEVNLRAARNGSPLAMDQTSAVLQLACDGHGLGLLIGPAGTGKTTTVRALVEAWRVAGMGEVHGLAPTAVAAAVLKEATGMSTAETVHAWELTGTELLHEGDLVVVDEAGMVSTPRLLRIADAAARVGAKVVLVGDYRQLSAIESGGALRLLATDTPDCVAELTSVWRFGDRNADGSWKVRTWEAEASLGLRHGDPAALDAYFAHDRIAPGAEAVLVEQVYQAWRADTALGMEAVMIAASTEVVAELSARARADRVAAGLVEPGGVPLADGNLAGLGDVVVTRRNARLLRAGEQFVKNGDLWKVYDRAPSGALTVEHLQHHGRVHLPADYVTGNVESGYAMTVHRAQGTTVDSAHALIDATYSRELLYVAATRGRESNVLHVVTDPVLDVELERPAPPDRIARAVLTDVLRAQATELSAIETQREAWAAIDSAATLLPRYDYAAGLLTGARAAEEVVSALPEAIATRLRREAAWPALADRIELLEERGQSPRQLLADLLEERDLHGAADAAAVLHARLAPAVAASRPEEGDWLPQPPDAPGPVAEYLRELRVALDARVDSLGAVAAAERPAWTTALGPVPEAATDRRTWEGRAGRVAAYREAYGITGDDPLGPVPREPRQGEAHALLSSLLNPGPAVRPGHVAEDLAAAVLTARVRLEVAQADYWAAAEVDPADIGPAREEIERAQRLVQRIDEAKSARAGWEAAVQTHARYAADLTWRERLATDPGLGRGERKAHARQAEHIRGFVTVWAEHVAADADRVTATARGLPPREAWDAARADAQATLDRAGQLLERAGEEATERARQSGARAAACRAAYEQAREGYARAVAAARQAGIPVEEPERTAERVVDVGREIDL